MSSYSIVRIGDDYVVRADDKNILKVASRRRAAQLVSDAAELLNAQPPPVVDGEPPTAEPVPLFEVPARQAASPIQELQIAALESIDSLGARTSESGH
jgi:hypothetical protein